MLKISADHSSSDSSDSAEPCLEPALFGRPSKDHIVETDEKEQRRLLMAQRAEERHQAHLARGLGIKGAMAVAKASAVEQAERQRNLSGYPGQKPAAEANRDRWLAAGLGMGAETASKASTSTGSASTCSVPVASSSSSSDQEPLYILTVIRSGLWGPENGPEDIWQVEVPHSASALEVKEQILELYGVPVEAQRLQCTPSHDDECLDDQAVVAQVLGTSVHLEVADVLLYLLPSARWLAERSSSPQRQQEDMRNQPESESEAESDTDSLDAGMQRWAGRKR